MALSPSFVFVQTHRLLLHHRCPSLQSLLLRRPCHPPTPNPGPNGNIAGPRPFFQPQGPNSRSIVPVPGTVYGDVAEATMVQSTLGVMLPRYPPPQFVGEFPVFYPGVGWVSSDNAPNQQAS